jgi:hypothetical protein
VLQRSAHAVLGGAMVAMLWPGGPGWLTLTVSAVAGVWFLGTAVVRRRPADLHHTAMAAAMVWMAAMPAAACHGSAGSVAGAVAGAVASYFLLAAAPFLTGAFRGRPQPVGATLASLGHAAMSLAMAAFLA